MDPMEIDSESDAWEPPPTASDSDSEWEPPTKRRRLNTKTKKSATKKRTKKKDVKKKAKKSATRRKSFWDKQKSTKPKKMDPIPPEIKEIDSDIEIMPNYVSKSSTKKKKAKTPKRKLTTKRKAVKKKKAKKNKFKAVSTAIVYISNPDALISGCFRNVSENRNDLNIIPTVITDIIFKYEQNVKYMEINFVWTHKYQCCQTYASCKYLKNNRGQYVFERDVGNRFDSNAIKIVTKSGKQVGHVPRDIAACLAPLLDENKIDLQCIGGSKTKKCSEMVEVIPLTKLTKRETTSLQEFYESIPFDMNRYVRPEVV